VETARDHPSDILDYFIPEEKVAAYGFMPLLEQNCLDEHVALDETTPCAASRACSPRHRDIYNAEPDEGTVDVIALETALEELAKLRRLPQFRDLQAPAPGETTVLLGASTP
jgi:hypothetical protein